LLLEDEEVEEEEGFFSRFLLSLEGGGKGRRRRRRRRRRRGEVRDDRWCALLTPFISYLHMHTNQTREKYGTIYLPSLSFPYAQGF